MTRQRIYIEKYDWLIDCYYDTKSENAIYLLGRLQGIGCRGEDYIKARKLLMSGNPNEGVTFSNGAVRMTICIIGSTNKDKSEFFNSWEHEANHIHAHMIDALGIDHKSEEAAYLKGDLAQAMYSVASKFLCGC